MGFWSRFFRDRLAVAGLVIVLSFFALSILTPVIAPYDPSAIDVDSILMPPSARHLFGTDDLGRDVFTRMLYGAGISREGSLIDMGVDAGIIRKAGAWFTYEADQLGQGKENARNFLRNNPDVAAEIERRIRLHLGIDKEDVPEGINPETGEVDF